MRIVRLHQFGDPQVLQIEKAQVPRPVSDEVLLKVHASSINFSDLGMRRGDMKLLSFWRMPLTPGYDVAGEVVDCGPEVTAFLPGDKVYALLGLQAGGFAEYVTVAQEKLGRAPASISLTHAAAIPLAGLTALQALRGKAGIHLRKGQRVLVNGASGGVGAFAVQIAKAFGCHVTGVASKEKIDFVRGQGADAVIDYAQTDFAFGPEKWHVVIDAAGMRAFEQVRNVLTPDGVMVTTRPSPKGMLASVTNLVNNGPGYAFVITKASGQDLDFLAAMIDRKQIQVPIDRIFPMEEVVAAHQYAESKHARGKVVVSITDTLALQTNN